MPKKGEHQTTEKQQAYAIRVGVWGRWTLIYPPKFVLRLEGKRKQKKLFVGVRCRCGTEDFIYLRNLRLRISRACRACYHRGKDNVRWSGYKDMPGDLIHRTRHSAKARGIEWKLSDKILFNLYERQERKCALSGVELNWDTASVDRIDSNFPYEATNIQWVHKRINIMKHTSSVNEFVLWCKKVAAKNFQPTP